MRKEKKSEARRRNVEEIWQRKGEREERARKHYRGRITPTRVTSRDGTEGRD